MSPPILEVEGLRAGYDAVPVLRGLDLHVEAGEVVALLGPNGAGKTTTLLAISGLLERLGGSVKVAGEPIPGLRKAHLLARRGVAHVPESRGVIGSLTVRENLQLAVGKSRLNLDPIEEFFPALLALLNRQASLCSGGEQQMLALGRALLARPKLLMVDEMSLGLAPIIFGLLMPVMRRVADELGTAVLLVEQYVDLALTIADRAYVLNHGELAISGSAQQLRDDRSALDAAYLGGGHD